MTDNYDLIVLGGGMAGLPVAMKSAYAEMDVALVEEDLLGGTGLNRGCIPTKTMIRSAEVANLARRSEEFGIDVGGEISVDLDAVIQRKDGLVESIREGAYDNVAVNDNVTLVEEHALFVVGPRAAGRRPDAHCRQDRHQHGGASRSATDRRPRRGGRP